MAFLGYMLQTDEEHEGKLRELSRIEEIPVETMINILIDERYNVYHPNQ